MPGASLRQRNRQPEVMDQPDLDAAEHHQALHALARINWLSASARILWPSIRDLCWRMHPQPLRLLDIATGGGDVPVRLWHKARRRGLKLDVAGCDLSPLALEHARRFATERKADVTFFTLDVLNEPIPAGYDIITSSLFLHHLDEGQAINVLTKMREAAGNLALVNDLARSRMGWLAATIGSRVLTRSRTVHVDARLSVEGAFTPEEALALAQRAGWEGATVRRKFPYRYLLSWSRW